MNQAYKVKKENQEYPDKMEEQENVVILVAEVTLVLKDRQDLQDQLEHVVFLVPEDLKVILALRVLLERQERMDPEDYLALTLPREPKESPEFLELDLLDQQVSQGQKEKKD